jgi:hypothetical protein
MEVQIGDPSAVKPVEWNEDEPEKLVDPKAIKPAGWDDNGIN